MYQTLSARLRTDIKHELGAAVLTALQDHLYHKALGYFDASANWQMVDVLELSELAHRLRYYAERLDSVSPTKLEAMRFATQIWNDYALVYKTAMRRSGATETAVA